MATEIFTEIRIAASPAKVWNILMDFEKYGEWNPFITAISGRAVVGELLSTRMLPPGGSPMAFTPRVLVADAEKEFRWLGSLWMKGIFDGEHRFELRANADGSTTLVHAERFRGILVPLLKKMLNTKTRAGFEQMNAALKARAEKV